MTVLRIGGLVGIFVVGKWLLSITYDVIAWRECVSFRGPNGWAATIGREWR